MIGTKVVLGFDGAAVKRGLANVGSMMGRFGRQVAIGGARQIGAFGTGLIGRALGAAPEALQDMMGYVGELNDLSAATGESIGNLMKLREAFRLAGADSVDAGRMISTMRKSVSEASREPGDMREAFAALGLDVGKLIDLKPEAMFQKIGAAIGQVKEGTGAFRNMDEIVSRIFGGRMGFRMMGAFRDLPATMQKAKENTQGFVDELGDAAPEIDATEEAIGRFELTKRTAALRALKGVMGGNLSGAAESIDQLMSNPLGGSGKLLMDGLNSAINNTPVLKSMSTGVEQVVDLLETISKKATGVFQ